MNDVNGNTMDGLLLKSLELFQAVIDQKDNLEIICYEAGGACNGSDILVVEDSDVSTELEGHQTTVELPEIFAKAKDMKSAQAFVDVITNDRKAVVLNGITRIVGYYSRVNNWNKSKIGELRDRHGRHYALSGKTPEHEDARLSLVNNS